MGAASGSERFGGAGMPGIPQQAAVFVAALFTHPTAGSDGTQALEARDAGSL